jgi:hypothetical protein
LDVTIGYPRDVPPSLEVAAGREISIDEARHVLAATVQAPLLETRWI